VDRLFGEVQEADGGGGQQEQATGDDEAPNAGIFRFCFGVADEGGAHIAVAVLDGPKCDRFHGGMQSKSRTNEIGERRGLNVSYYRSDI
jgi:hypothetical protein